jgi:hypothetical protein
VIPEVTIPPYLPTNHSWSCNAGHEIVLNDRGWPQARGFKQSVLNAWHKYNGGSGELRCPECGGRAEYKTEFANAEGPVVASPAPPVVVVSNADDFKRFGREMYARPCTRGGFFESLRDAGKKRC